MLLYNTDKNLRILTRCWEALFYASPTRIYHSSFLIERCLFNNFSLPGGGVINRAFTVYIGVVLLSFFLVWEGWGKWKFWRCKVHLGSTVESHEISHKMTVLSGSCGGTIEAVYEIINSKIGLFILGLSSNAARPELSSSIASC